MTVEPPRATFEERRSTAAVPLVPWVTDGLDLSLFQVTADLGCGDGRFALPVARSTAPTGGVVYAVDEDANALARLDRSAQHEGLPITTINGDVTEPVGLPEGQFDLVMLNFVLHLMSPPKKVRQSLEHAIDLLRPSGRLLVTTYGRQHMAVEYEWLEQALVDLGVGPSEAKLAAERAQMRNRPWFTLDDGQDLLGRYFERVELVRFDDILELDPSDVFENTMPRLFDAAVRSGLLPEGLSVQTIGDAIVHAVREGSRDGVVRVRCDMGTLTASEPRERAASTRRPG